MPLEAIACNQCGAPLQVPDAAQFVTCNHCGASLAVRREESVTYTEVIAQLAEHTSKLAEQVAHLRYQNELERIDREWEVERQQYLVKTKRGAPQEPTTLGAVIGGVVFAAFGLIFFGNAPAESGFRTIAVIIAGVGILTAVFGSARASKFQQAKSKYQQLRSSMSVEKFMGSQNDDKDR